MRTPGQTEVSDSYSEVLFRKMYMQGFLPLQDFEAIREQINQVFDPLVRSVPQEPNRTYARSIPIELTETPTEFKLRANLAGVDPNTIDIQATDRVLSISTGIPVQELSKDEVMHIREFTYGSVRRQLEFGESIEPDHITAESRHGILTLVIPKADASRKRTIKIDIQH